MRWEQVSKRTRRWGTRSSASSRGGGLVDGHVVGASAPQGTGAQAGWVHREAPGRGVDRAPGTQVSGLSEEQGVQGLGAEHMALGAEESSLSTVQEQADLRGHRSKTKL